MVIQPIGSGPKPFAFILVNYPSDTISLSCTNSIGYKDITPTQRLYYVQNGVVPFTCSITGTNGTSTTSKTVSISYEGQSENIEISYTLYIVQDGVALVPTYIQGGYAYTSGGNYVDCTNGKQFHGTRFYFDATGLSTLYITITGGRAYGSAPYRFGVFNKDEWVSTGTGALAQYLFWSNNGRGTIDVPTGTFSVDISSITGEVECMLAGDTSEYSSRSFSNIWATP